MKKHLIITALILFGLTAAVFAANNEQLYYCPVENQSILLVNPDKVSIQRCENYHKRSRIYPTCREISKKISSLYNTGKCYKIDNLLSDSLENVYCSFDFDETNSLVIGSKYVNLNNKNKKAQENCLSTLATEVKKQYPKIITHDIGFAKYGFKYIEKKDKDE